MQHFYLASLCSLVLLSACKPAAPEGISNLEVRLPAAPGRPGVSYFKVTGGKKEGHLMSLSSPKIVRIELHESMTMGNMTQMKALAGGVTIPAGATVEFAPGGRHAMLFDISPAVKAGDKIPMTFLYADGHKVEAEALVKAPGDAPEHQH